MVTKEARQKRAEEVINYLSGIEKRKGVVLISGFNDYGKKPEEIIPCIYFGEWGGCDGFLFEIENMDFGQKVSVPMNVLIAKGHAKINGNAGPNKKLIEIVGRDGHSVSYSLQTPQSRKYNEFMGILNNTKEARKKALEEIAQQ